MGIDIKENSAEEIRQGALEMISTLDNPLQAQTEYNVQELSSIRANFPWTSSGFFSQKFIEMNEGWLNS
jgi:hypothetical protein